MTLLNYTETNVNQLAVVHLPEYSISFKTAQFHMATIQYIFYQSTYVYHTIL